MEVFVLYPKAENRNRSCLCQVVRVHSNTRVTQSACRHNAINDIGSRGRLYRKGKKVVGRGEGVTRETGLPKTNDSWETFPFLFLNIAFQSLISSLIFRGSILMSLFLLAIKYSAVFSTKGKTQLAT